MPKPDRPWADLCFRILFSLIFIVAGLGHFGQRAEMLSRLEAAPLGNAIDRSGLAEPAMIASGVVLIVGGILLALGLFTRWAAIALFVALVPITLTVHVANPGHAGPLFKNVALLGGLIHFSVNGPGAMSLRRD
jgi:putative oxidoreductase